MIEIPFGKFVRPVRFKSRNSSEHYGSYHHQYILDTVDASMEDLLDLEAIQDFVATNPPPSEQLSVALQNAAAIHEYRHFFDCFGTVAGITLFGTYLIELKEFLRACSYLGKQGLVWKLPIWEWIKDNDCPEHVKSFAESYKQRVRYREIFMGGMELPPEPGFTDEVWRDCNISQLDITFPLYPLKSMALLRKGNQTIAQDTATIWHSVGFETIVEGNAQAMQRDLLEALWPTEIVELAWKTLTQAERPADDINAEDLFKHHKHDVSIHYNVTDYLVSKYLSQNYGIGQYPRSLIMQVSDIALMESLFPDGSHTPIKRHPGHAFTNVLQTTQWVEPLDSCIRESVTTEKTISDLIGTLSEYPRPEYYLTNKRDPTLINIVAIVESYAQHEIVVPLLKFRLENGNKAFYDLSKFFNSFPSLPKPLVSIFKGQLRHFLPDQQAYVMEAWALFAMIRNIFEQIMSGSVVICCPRAYETVPGINIVEFAKPPGRCKEHISRRACLAWAPGRELSSQLPNCFFTDIVRDLRLG